MMEEKCLTPHQSDRGASLPVGGAALSVYGNVLPADAPESLKIDVQGLADLYSERRPRCDWEDGKEASYGGWIGYADGYHYLVACEDHRHLVGGIRSDCFPYRSPPPRTSKRSGGQPQRMSHE